MDPAGQLAQLVEGELELLLRPFDELERAPVLLRKAVAGESQREGERDEPLLGAVVEVALEAPPFLVLRPEEPHAGGAEVALSLLALGDVADEAGEGGRSGQRDARDRELDRELGAVGAHAGDLEPLAEDSRVTGVEVTGEPGAVLVAKARRDDHLDHLAADDLVGLVPEGPLGGRVEFEHAPVVVDRDDAIERRLEDRSMPRLSLAHRSLGAAALDELADLAAEALGRRQELVVGLLEAARHELDRAHDPA